MISVYFLPEHDEISKKKKRTYTLCFIALVVFSFLVNINQHYNFAAMGKHLTKQVEKMMFSKILTFEVGWFDKNQNCIGAICSWLAKDANVVSSLF